MPTCLAYRLSFRSPLHIGERGVGQEETHTHVPADTLFSAVCSAWRLLYGEESLGAEVIERFGSREGSAPFFLSSAFPFAGPVRFFPRPLTRFPGLEVEGDEKALKRVRWVSETLLRALLAGQALRFRPQDCVSGGAAWAAAEESSALDAWMDDEQGEVVLWKTAVVPRVTLDRVTSASEIWHFGRLTFQEGCGLWFAVSFAEGEGETRRRLEACLRLLGDTGLGGERGAGHGLFSLEGPEPVDLPDVSDARHFVTLAPVCPRDAPEVEALTGPGAAYALLPRRGWIGSPEGGNLRRKMVWMFAEGSVLCGGGVPPPGCLVDVTPDVPTAHRVCRYGYGFPLGVSPG